MLWPTLSNARRYEVGADGFSERAAAAGARRDRAAGSLQPAGAAPIDFVVCTSTGGTIDLPDLLRLTRISTPIWAARILGRIRLDDIASHVANHWP